MGEKYTELVEHLRDVRNVNRANALLSWDQETKMPPKGIRARADAMETLSRLGHEMFVSERTAELLDAAGAEVADADYASTEASMVRIVAEDYEEATKLPSKFVGDFTRLVSEAKPTWAEARANNDFEHFRPTLERIVEMSREKAEYIGYDDHIYDGLLYSYERSLKTADVKALFDGHRDELVELVAAIAEVADRVDDAPVKQDFDIDTQKQFSLHVAEMIGYDFERGRLDEAVHPFSLSLSKNDSRITTRYNDDWLNPALFGTMHECGHSMYEQGIADELEGTMLGRGTSLSVHESQSRTWENLVGRSRGFWTYMYPKLVETFPGQFENTDVDTFYKAINKVEPSFIRVEADECSYNLHIMLRFEIEQQIIGGDLAVKDIPDAWNSMFEASLGIVPPTDTLGCLQDIHWSMGGFGYFSTYALGNLLSLQYYNQAVQDVPSIPHDIASGNFSTLLTWSNENIHQHGRKFDTRELTKKVTGNDMRSTDYIAYLKEKFSAIYDL